MNVLLILVVILLLAFMVESLVEFFLGAIFQHVERIKPYSWCLMYVAAAVGIIGAFLYQFDMLSLLSIFLGTIPPIPVSPFGMILTGLTIGRGSNAVHDLIMRFFKKDPLALAKTIPKGIAGLG